MRQNNPAFPTESQSQTDMGLTIREYLAGQAMHGILANDWRGFSNSDPDCETLAKTAVNYADALIAALNSKQE